MSTYINVYCTRSIQHITSDEILDAILGPKADIHMAAEAFGIEDDAIVDLTINHLRVGNVRKGSRGKFYIRYRDPKFRPLLIYLDTDPDDVQEFRKEALEFLKAKRGKGVKRVRTLLDQVIEVAAVELGLAQLDGMPLVLAVQVAEYLAEIGKGVVSNYHEWWSLPKGFPVQLVGPKRRNSQ